MPQTLLKPKINQENNTYTTPIGWVPAERIVSDFTHELEFEQLLETHGVNPNDRSSIQYAHALSDYVREYTDKVRENPETDQKRLSQICILANTPYFMHIQKEVAYFEYDLDRHQRLSDEDWNEFQDFKPYLIWFNQQISDYAYSSPSEKITDVDAALISQVEHLFPEELSFIEKEVKQVVRGARTEAVARELLDRTPIDFSPGTVEDDLHGGDFIVLHNGHRIKVDIKSSRSSVARVRGGYEEMEKRNISYAISINKHDKTREQHVVVLYPGFSDKDLGDSLRLQLPDDIIQEHADYVAQQLSLAFEEIGL
jgi:hypothetical protein